MEHSGLWTDLERNGGECSLAELFVKYYNLKSKRGSHWKTILKSSKYIKDMF